MVAPVPWPGQGADRLGKGAVGVRLSVYVQRLNERRYSVRSICWLGEPISRKGSMYTEKDIPRYLKKIADAEKDIKNHPDWPNGLNEMIIADAIESLRLCGYKPNAKVRV